MSDFYSNLPEPKTAGEVVAELGTVIAQQKAAAERGQWVQPVTWFIPEDQKLLLERGIRAAEAQITKNLNERLWGDPVPRSKPVVRWWRILKRDIGNWFIRLGIGLGGDYDW